MEKLQYKVSLNIIYAHLISLLAILWNSAFRCLYLSFSPFLFTSLLFTAICKAFSDSHFAFYSIEPCFYHQSHPQLGVVLLWLHPFILSGVISPLISSSILGTYRPGEFSVISFAFSFSSWGSQGKNTEVVCHSLLLDHILSELSTMIRPSWVAPQGMA